MHLKTFLVILSVACFSVACSPLSPSTPQPDTANQNAPLPSLPSSTKPTLATPASQSPAAGICAEFSGDWVTITINPDMPDPRCSKITADQMLEVINNRAETVLVKLGHLEATLAPGESHKFELPFGDYLAPGVHRIEVQPCCGAELVLDEN